MRTARTCGHWRTELKYEVPRPGLPTANGWPSPGIAETARVSSKCRWAAAPRSNTLSINPVWSPDGGQILYSEQQRAGQFEVKAMTPDRTQLPIVALQIVGFSTSTHYRFMPQGDALIELEGVIGASQNVFKVDLATGERRQLTDLDGTYVIRNFDVSPDGTRIVFDRWRQHTDIAMMTLAR